MQPLGADFEKFTVQAVVASKYDTSLYLFYIKEKYKLGELVR